MKFNTQKEQKRIADARLTELFFGDKEQDARLLAAYELGLRQGRTADRENLWRAAQIEATTQLLTTLMRVFQLDLQTAMVKMEIPRKERKTYVKIFAEKNRQKHSRST